MDKLLIRPELASDKESSWLINRAAFERSDEADLVERLREAGQISLSLVAVLNEKPIGHMLFSPVSVATNPQHYPLWGLGPIAVLPEFQRRGVGKQLIEQGLERCKNVDVAALVVLGHSSYYLQFGFEPAPSYGLYYKGKDVGDAFMVLELRKHGLASLSGAVHYLPAFG